jgi:phosphocarrier protein HPr
MSKASTYVTIKSPRGLHATPACMLAQTAMKFDSRIRIDYANGIVSAKNLMAVVALGVQPHQSFYIYADGEDAHEAIAALRDLIEVRNFDGE